LSKCEDVRPRLTAFLDGEVEDSDEIKSHLESCPECRKLLDTHRKVTRLSALVPGPSPHPEAWARFDAKLSSLSRGRTNKEL
jgi:predicted anti-sigma-YlaC factor YlaD